MHKSNVFPGSVVLGTLENDEAARRWRAASLVLIKRGNAERDEATANCGRNQLFRASA